MGFGRPTSQNVELFLCLLGPEASVPEVVKELINTDSKDVKTQRINSEVDEKKFVEEAGAGYRGGYRGCTRGVQGV